MNLTHKIPFESIAFAEMVKPRILQYDRKAEIVLFGSRARGDAEVESDWDLLVLTEDKDVEKLNKKLLKDLLYQVEMPNNLVISLLVRNKEDWEKHYAVTPLYDSIRKEGILL